MLTFDKLWFTKWLRNSKKKIKAYKQTIFSLLPKKGAERHMLGNKFMQNSTRDCCLSGY